MAERLLTLPETKIIYTDHNVINGNQRPATTGHHNKKGIRDQRPGCPFDMLASGQRLIHALLDFNHAAGRQCLLLLLRQRDGEHTVGDSGCDAAAIYIIGQGERLRELLVAELPAQITLAILALLLLLVLLLQTYHQIAVLGYLDIVVLLCGARHSQVKLVALLVLAHINGRASGVYFAGCGCIIEKVVQETRHPVQRCF